MTLTIRGKNDVTADQGHLRAVPQDDIAGVLSGDIPQKAVWRSGHITNGSWWMAGSPLVTIMSEPIREMCCGRTPMETLLEWLHRRSHACGERWSFFLTNHFVSLPIGQCDSCRVNSMSFAGKNLTQGGQMTAYRWRMFFQVNNWIGFWIFILFAVLAAVIFFLRIPQKVLDNGSLCWFASISSSFSVAELYKQQTSDCNDVRTNTPLSLSGKLNVIGQVRCSAESKRATRMTWWMPT